MPIGANPARGSRGWGLDFRACGHPLLAVLTVSGAAALLARAFPTVVPILVAVVLAVRLPNPAPATSPHPHDALPQKPYYLLSVVT